MTPQDACGTHFENTGLIKMLTSQSQPLRGLLHHTQQSLRGCLLVPFAHFQLLGFFLPEAPSLRSIALPSLGNFQSHSETMSETYFIYFFKIWLQN